MTADDALRFGSARTRFTTWTFIKRARGCTLVELLIIVAIIATIAAIALQMLISARISSNAAAAIATLKNIVSAHYEGTANMPPADAAIENGSTGTIIGEFSCSNRPAPAVAGSIWRPVN